MSGAATIAGRTGPALPGDPSPAGAPARQPNSRQHRADGLRVTQLRVVRSEWTKLVSLRSTVWTMVAAVGLTIGLGAIISAAMVANWDSLDATDRAEFDPTFYSLSGVQLALLAIGVLGVLVMSGEYSTGMIRASLGAVPKRLPVLWAKVAVFAAASFVLLAVSSLVAFQISQAVLSAENIDTSLTEPGVFRAVMGAAFYGTVVGLLGLALGTLFRSTPAAIGVLFGVLLILPLLAGMLPASWDGVADYLPSAGGEAIMTVVSSGGGMSPGGGFLLLCAYLVTTIGAAAYQLHRRDA